MKGKPSVPAGALLAGRYEITRLLGRGGMASVYEGRHTEIGKRVAIKILSSHLLEAENAVERFLREAQAAAAVHSPNICDVYDAGRLEDGRPFLVLELLKGESLYERLSKVGCLEVPDALRVAFQVARGLSVAHRAGVIHRDLKPENIFLAKTDEGEEIAKIVDFGLAKFHSALSQNTSKRRLTADGAVLGTPLYMSPEQVAAQILADHRTDLWALGCIVYECLTGETVWSMKQGIPMVFAQVATAPIPVPTMLRPELPRAFDTWIDHALERDLAKRFQTADELSTALAKAFEGHDEAPDSLETTGPVSLPRPLAPTEIEVTTDEDAEEPPKSTPDPVPFTPPLPKSKELEEDQSSPLPPPQESKSSKGLMVALVLGVAAAGLAGYGGWTLANRASRHTPPPDVTSSTSAPSAPVAAASSSSPPARSSVSAALSAPAPATSLRRGQVMVRQGKLQEAIALYEEAAEAKEFGVSMMRDHLKLAVGSKGPCKLTALGRPRPTDRLRSVLTSTVARTSRGTVAAWVDDHDARGKWHVHTALLDDALRVASPIVDATPDAGIIENIEMVATANGILLVYGDVAKRGGVSVRRLDLDGKPVGSPVRVVEGRASAASPSVAVTSNATWLAFDNRRLPSNPKIYLHKLDASFVPAPAAIDISPRKAAYRTLGPSIRFSKGHLLLAYRREGGGAKHVVVESIPEDVLDAVDEKNPKVPRAPGRSHVLTDKQTKGTDPYLACDEDLCFAVFRGQPSGAHVARIDATTGKAAWRKSISKQGTNVSVVVDAKRGSHLLWHEPGVVKIASLGEEQIGEPSSIGRAEGKQPRSTIVPGAGDGRWLVGWTSFDAGRREAFVAEVSCSK